MAKPVKPYKVGRLKKSEEQYIFAHSEKMAPEEIASKLNRSINQVLKTLSKVPTLPKSQSPKIAELRLGLKESALWKTMRAEFDPDELVFFEEQYVALMDQFTQGNEEVLHTEESQLFKVIKFDILKHRNAMRQKRCKKEIERIENVHDTILKSAPYSKLSTEEKSDLKTLELNMAELLAQQSQFSTEYVKLEEKHQKLMEALKATRQQRIDKIAGSKLDFLGLLRSLGEDIVVEEHDKLNEMMRRATFNEEKRLSQPTIFADGELDIPLLNEKTFEFEEK